MNVIKAADRLIALGPEGGEDGGQIIAQGPPEQIAEVPESYTGSFCGKWWAGKPSEPLSPSASQPVC